jgi:hypothetical protein
MRPAGTQAQPSGRMAAPAIEAPKVKPSAAAYQRPVMMRSTSCFTLGTNPFE